ncbi:ABC transporter ATP-binding protein [Winslowiella iniecta]|uniref:Iron-enterobactin transporter ATP-binding protein n=1 Tax=Winslowiella iniecta TaxID=1560201 RepID=A0A0L7TEU9_9GAMM|nr:ABC transporter ATP-binding protein [Winslowiella iniecta]KOC91064.1 iron-enterobactin transporter ATP-binding protein [Winslowiella iniecta]KOC93796.1 iron-enterobactin transporter ATP-binding protein [Winslowiella iniecta]
MTSATHSSSRLQARQLTLSYGAKPIVEQVDLALREGEFSVIIGPNGCGKSTLLRAFSRGMMPQSGEVLLDDINLHQHKPRQVARELALLSQSSLLTDTLSVFDLVSRGRYPHQSFLRPWSAQDEQVVNEALSAVDLSAMAQTPVQALSGGQRQRAWFAMTLAQQTPIILLDEPTTWLDIAHQIELLELCRGMHQQGKTLVMVLHDINQALRYATHLIMMKEGKIVAQGAPQAVVTEDSMAQVFGLDCRIIDDPESGKPLIIPRFSRTP